MSKLFRPTKPEPTTRISVTVQIPALDNLAEAIGDGLHAIALALSTKEDNSAQILEFANKVKTAREKLKQSVDNQTKGD